MKKTFSRAFSLLLVLALLVSVIPSALADGVGEPEPGTGPALTTPEVSVSPETATIKVNEPTNLTATITNGEQDATVRWTTTAGTGSVELTPSGNTVTVTGKTEGTATVTATYTKDQTDYSASASITITAAEPATPTLAINQQDMTLAYNTGTTLTASYTGVTGEAPAITWISSAPEIVEVNASTGVVKVKKGTGSAVITAKSADESIASDTITITATKQEVEATVSVSKTNLTVGQAATLSISGVPEAVKSKITVSNWRDNTADVVTLTTNADNTATATGKTAGKNTTVSVDVTLVDDNYALKGANDNNTVPLTSTTITVGSATLTCTTSATSLKSGSTSTLTITPSIANKDLPNGASSLSDITFDYLPTMQTTGTSVSVNVTKSTNNGKTIFTVSSPKGEGTVKITIQASYNNEVIASQTVTIGVYEEYEIYATLKNNVSTFEFDEAVFSYMKKGNKVLTTSDTLQSALTGNTAYGTITFECNNNILKLNTTSSSSRWLGDVQATVQTGKSGTQTIGYTWYGDDNVKVAEGLIYITVGETTGDIVYNTSYTEKVIFDDSDFTKFWNSKVSSGAVSGTFSHVTFEDMVTGVNPRYGQLYRDTSCSNKVTRDQMFTTSSKTGYLLDNVTYKPDSSITTPVTVQIPFTAYSTGTTTTRKSVSGVIVININQATTTITSYGVGFGNGTKSIADVIAETFKANTGDTISYVTFPAISTSTGKLFYNFSGVLKSREVLSTYKFYYNGSKTDLDLDDVVFVPRAGLYGEVTLYYKAYNASATKEYSGTIVLNVQQKTKSAEFSDVGTSYSWAADSVDFLSYEGVAQGSNGKYRPTANITRGDFMLMLYRAFLEDEHKNDSITSNFSDVVKGSDTYSKETYQAVGVAKKLGIAQGTNGKFNPKSNITRQEAMTLIYRTLDEVNYDLEYTVSATPSSFKDYSSVASYAKTAISDLIGHGIVIGNNSKINPTSNITRAEMAVILHRVLTY